MKNFLFGAAIAFLAYSGYIHRHLTSFGIEAYDLHWPGDLYSPTRGAIELMSAGVLLVVAIARFRRQRSANRSVSYPPRQHFPSPVS